MNESVKQMFEAHERQVKKEVLLQVVNKLNNKAYQYDRILHNEVGRAIYENSMGRKFDRLNFLRDIIFVKWRTTNEIIGQIYATIYP